MANYAYLRVSADDQTLDRQRAIFNNNSFNITIDKWFEEKASGKDTNRKQLQQLLTELKEGDTLFVTGIDRLSRSLIDFNVLVNKIHKKIKANIYIIELRTEITAGERINPYTEYFLNNLATFSQFERSMIEKRRLESMGKHKESMERAKAEGKMIGKRKPQITAKQLHTILAMLKTKTSMQKIADFVGVSKRTVMRYTKKDSRPRADDLLKSAGIEWKWED